MIPSIVEARVAHIPAIAARVRPEDEAELWAFACLSPTHVMLQSLNLSIFARTGFIDEKPVCMFGVVRSSYLGRSGRPWMVGTDLLDKYSNIFLRRCGSEVRDMLSQCNRLENYVDARNKKAILWLRWLGFQFGEPQPMGPFNLPFIKFSMER
jgi:hypothetical protein